jgi:hypothetical protein
MTDDWMRKVIKGVPCVQVRPNFLRKHDTDISVCGLCPRNPDTKKSAPSKICDCHIDHVWVPETTAITWMLEE